MIRMSYTPPFTITERISTLCIEIAEMVGRLSPDSSLSTDPVLHRELQISSIHSSLAIEQNSLTEEQVTAILGGKRVLGPADDIREVENADRAYGMIDGLDPYSLDDLLRAHGTMMAGLREDAGRFRSGNVGVYQGTKLIHAGTPAAYVPEVMADLFDWLSRTDVHPLIASCVFHYEFEFIHPFADGNGRTGRLWHTLLLARWRPVLRWLPVESLILQRQNGYYAAINDSNNAGNSTVFVEFMLTVIRDAMKPYATDDAANDASNIGAAARTVNTANSTATEEALLALVSNQPDITVANIAKELGIPRRSAERLIASLKAADRLTRIGSPRAGRWQVQSSNISIACTE